MLQVLGNDIFQNGCLTGGGTQLQLNIWAGTDSEARTGVMFTVNEGIVGFQLGAHKDLLRVGASQR